MPYITFGEQSRAVGPGVLTIGSGHEASWRIPGYDLAPVHALVAPERDGRAVIQRGSPSAVVYVNGAEVESATRPLAFGDVIRLGGAELRYVESQRQGTGEEGYLCDVRHNRVYKLLRENSLGRELKCNVLLHDTTASRLHADIKYDDGRFTLTPSGGVTFVNGRHVAEPVALKDGDEIGIGRTVLRFSHDMPSYALVVENNDTTGRTSSAADRRASKVQTTFMGVVEQREMMQKQRSRQLGKVAAVAIGAALVLGAIVAALTNGPAPAAKGSAAARTAPPAAAGAAVPAPQPPRTESTATGTVTPAGATSPPR